jgi:hypothetical protein
MIHIITIDTEQPASDVESLLEQHGVAVVSLAQCKRLTLPDLPPPSTRALLHTAISHPAMCKCRACVREVR